MHDKNHWYKIEYGHFWGGCAINILSNIMLFSVPKNIWITYTNIGVGTIVYYINRFINYVRPLIQNKDLSER